MSSLQVVFSNIQLIYGAVCRTDTEELQLASTDGINLSKKDSLSYSFSLSSWIYSDSVHNALAHTAKQFQQLQEDWVKPQLASYEDYLGALKRGLKHVEQPQSARKHISEWYQGTAQFLELFNPEKMPKKLGLLLEKYFPSQQPFADVHAAKVRRYVAIINMESLSRNPPPINDWCLKCTDNEDLKDKPSHKRWIEGFVHDGGTQATSYVLLKGIQGVTDYLKEIEVEKSPDLFDPSHILYTLWNPIPSKNQYFGFLTSPDPVQIEWRKNLKKNDKLGKYQITGRYLESTRAGGHSVFMLDDPNVVAKAYAQRVTPLLFAYSLKRFPPKVPLPKIIEVDSDGRFLILERFDEPAHALDRRNIKEIGEVEKAALKPACQILQYFLVKKWCPDIPLANFRMTSTGELRCLKPYREFPFWLEPLEDYAREISQDNPVVFKYLMKVLKFHDHFRYNIYADLMKEYAKGIEFQMTPGVVSNHVDEGHYEAWKVRVHELFLEVKKIREKINKRFHERFASPVSDEHFVRAVMAHYHDYECVSRLFPNSEDEIFNFLVQIHNGDETIGIDLKGPPINCLLL